MIAKITENNKKPTKHYREKKLGLIDRLSIALLKTGYPCKRYRAFSRVEYQKIFGYLMDFMLANIFCVIPRSSSKASLTGLDEYYTNTDIPLHWAYIITFFVFLFYTFYYVYIPLKIWPGQTPAKRLLNYKIVMMDNSKATAKALFMRNVIGMTFLELAAFTTTYVVQLIVLTAKIDYPASFGYITYFMTFLSFIITLTNYDRRMLHDYLGKTKVYMLQKEEVSDYHAL